MWAPSGRTAKPSGPIPAQAIDLPERPSSLKRSSAPTTSSPAPGPSATATDSATAELVEEFVAHCRPSAARRQPHRREGLRVLEHAAAGCLAGASPRSSATPPSRRRSERARGLPPTTPHTLRRPYVSLALLANPLRRAVSHEPCRPRRSRTTMDVDAQLQQRVQARARDGVRPARRPGARAASTGATPAALKSSSEQPSGHGPGPRATVLRPSPAGRIRWRIGGTRGTVMTRRDARPRLRQTVR